MLLEINNLKTHFHVAGDKPARAVDGISFGIAPGETVALVGESGSGKSVTAFSTMQLLPDNAFHPEGEILFEGRNLLDMKSAGLRRLRGNDMAMIFQEPMTSLNPLMRVERQIMEPLQIHRNMQKEEARAEVLELLKHVGIPAPEDRLRNYPHELSGGMRQRIMIAMALACRPKLLIADEPTTALDVTIQAQILGLIKDLQKETNMGVLFITHDLGVVNQIADRVCVMYTGKFMETGTREEIFKDMVHPYTRGLFSSLPTVQEKQHKLRAIPGSVPSATDYPGGCPFHPRCREKFERCAREESFLHNVEEGGLSDNGRENSEPQAEPGHCVSCHLLDPNRNYARDEEAWAARSARPERTALDLDRDLLNVENLKTHFPVKRGVFLRTVAHVKAVDDISLRFPYGATLALVGESGCGKTTAGLSILRLLAEAEGRIVFNSENVMAWDKAELRDRRKDLQIVFQDPFSALSPRMTVEDIVGEGMRIHYPQLTREERHSRVIKALGEVGLSAEDAGRYPHEFSGGQRQRISIARALVLEPQFLVLDEPTSALDVSVQAQILNLLVELQARHGWTYLFITHDLAVVEYMADFVAVMYLGKIVEYAAGDQVLSKPRHPYTRSLLKAVPRPDERKKLLRLSGEIPSPMNPPAGCYFHPRCPVYDAAYPDSQLHEQCPTKYPPVKYENGHGTACYAVD
ncbi:MAG: dipeptide ABC transporter ATP-binding protein [Lentisphaeria bacterium]